MIRKGLLDRFFEAASIQRWNDHVRPVEFTELDKQAHKMIIAYVIGKMEEDERKTVVDWRKLIEGGIFEFLQRVILTDIKPPVFHKLMSEKGNELNELVLKKLQDDVLSVKGDFSRKFESYLFDQNYSRLEKRLLRAAHYLATNWEFQIIYNTAPFVYGIDRTKEEIENQIEDHYDLIGVQKISLRKKSFGFIDLCGQLRFQQRWAQSPRVPKTSVLGHMLIVAMMSYFCSVEVDACDKRIYNNYFVGLLHDLPEVLTRDIVSPVKSSVEGLDEIIKTYERLHLEERILPLLPSSICHDIKYFLEEEFQNKIIEKGIICKGLTSEELASKYNEDRFSPVDGVIIKGCDKLAAFIEAALSINHGIKSQPLVEGKRYMYEIYKGAVIGGINFGQIFDDFN
ncbi:HD domain-containing protein [Desulforhabdus amnigena]|jgi:putative hydrolase of HD superfamily|uniref:Hydrolase n=1 Tax=Desulforhabdus amnigena TaxID=40218 RepID=A0A9W6D106_9BACT|nr:HD domain-containing protein [Desulforhabdus amnigena]NLJ29616.1 HD domain-containing protein [Deltaproteobacteria bacterium]GLI32663.1 hydrolase [Desulforhabdus amnigena]